MAKKNKEQQPETTVEFKNGTDPDSVDATEVTAENTETSEDHSSLDVQPDLEAELERVIQDLEESRDLHLRAKAELENQRKRSARELENAHKYAIDRFASELLDVMESLDQACQIERSDTSSDDLDAIRDGVELTQKQLVAVFQKFSIVEICPDNGDKFDPNIHQAMTLQSTNDVDPNHIVTTIRKGYSIHDRLLRPAMVIVAQALPKQSEAVDADDEAGAGQ